MSDRRRDSASRSEVTLPNRSEAGAAVKGAQRSITTCQGWPRPQPVARTAAVFIVELAFSFARSGRRRQAGVRAATCAAEQPAVRRGASNGPQSPRAARAPRPRAAVGRASRGCAVRLESEKHAGATAEVRRRLPGPGTANRRGVPYRLATGANPAARQQ